MNRAKVIIVKDIIFPISTERNIYVGTICEVDIEDYNTNSWVRLFELGTNNSLGTYSLYFNYFEILSEHREKQINSILDDEV